MDHDLRGWSRDELKRDRHLRRELEEASPSVGSAGLMIGAIFLVILGIVFFGQPTGDHSTVASRDPIAAPAPGTQTNSP